MQSESIEAVAAEGRSLRVSFVWHDDRFSHVISVVEPSGENTPVLESMEGTPVDNWPASPPLQNLTIEERPDGSRVALLVGMAGGSHWSASVEGGKQSPVLRFDVACRPGKETGWLGSKYRRLADSPVVIEAEGRTAIKDGDDVTIEAQGVVGNVGTKRWAYTIRMK